MTPLISLPEQPPAAFDAWAETYDEVFTDSCVGEAQRISVWSEIDMHFGRGQRILEINCGTGADALHLANRGVRVAGCDASRKMIAAAENRISAAGMQALVDLRVLPTEIIWQIEGAALFDGALSNFAGLNCVEDLSSTGMELARLLKPGAKLIICVFGCWCLWEIVWYLAHGNPLKAFRRVGPKGAQACLKNCELHVHYRSVRDLKHAFAPFFQLKSLKGVGVAIPPSYLEPLAIRHRRAIRVAAFLDRGLGRIPVTRYFADHLLLTFERVAD